MTKRQRSFKFSGGKLVIDDSLNVIGKLESKNYTSLGDGVYMVCK